MWSSIYEFFFCPMHGLLTPANWVCIAPALVGVKLLYHKLRSRI